MQLDLPDPYDFGLLVRFLSRWRHPALDRIADGTYRRVLRLPNGSVLIQAHTTGPASRTLDIAVLHAASAPDAVALEQRIRHVLAIDQSAASFWKWVGSHPLLGPVLSPVAGLPITRTETLYDGLVCAVIEQQIAWTAAQRAQRVLCEWGGESIEYAGEVYYALPAPARLAAADPAELKPLKITDRRVGVLIRLAADIESGRFDLEALSGLPMEGRYSRLIQIGGVGHWTAVVALSRAYGAAAQVASNDVALRAAVRRYLPQAADSADPVGAAFADCGAFAGLAATYLLARYVLDKY